MIDLAKERQLFEDRISNDGFVEFSNYSFEKDGSGDYVDERVECAWFSYLQAHHTQQQEIESLKRQVAQYQSDDYALVSKKEFTIWYVDGDEDEGMWLKEADNFLCEIEVGQVFTFQRQHHFSFPKVYVARPWSEEEQWSGHYKEYATKEEAEKVALHCKAMIEAQEQDRD